MEISTQYDIEMEAVVLGAILLEHEALERIISDLKPVLFHDTRHRIVCKNILELHKNGETIDLVTVARRVKENAEAETCTPYFISNLTSRVASSANIEYHVKVLQEMFLLRATKELGNRMIVKSIDPGTDPFELISKSINALETLEQGVINTSFDTIHSLSTEFLLDLEARRTKSIPAGISYGLKKIDLQIGGKNKTDLILLAARPGMGKTTMMLNWIRNSVIRLNKPVGVFSLEMSSLQLLGKIASAECDIDSSRFKTGDVTNEEINRVAQKFTELEKAPLYIDDQPGLSIYEIRNRARKLKRDFGIEELYLDYIQKSNTGGEHRGNREREIGRISEVLKEMAKELEIPVIALSQLSRSVETRINKMPILSDLRDSGGLEQDADLVFFLFRPEYYGDTVMNIDGIGDVSAKGKAFVIIAKNRHGALLDEVFGFSGEFNKFYDIENLYY